MLELNTAKNNLRASDRILVLTPVEGAKALNSIGMPDPRLFNGENRLHVIMDSQTCLWNFKYDKGMVPPVLKDASFTTFGAARKHAEDYFKKRNIAIKEVID